MADTFDDIAHAACQAAIADVGRAEEAVRARIAELEQQLAEAQHDRNARAETLKRLAETVIGAARAHHAVMDQKAHQKHDAARHSHEFWYCDAPTCLAYHDGIERLRTIANLGGDGVQLKGKAEHIAESVKRGVERALYYQRELERLGQPPADTRPA